MFKESVRMSWQNIINNKLRSFLTILGVLIGVASIIALISIVDGVTEDISQQVLAMGADKVTVVARGTALKQGLTANDLERLSLIENIDALAPSITGSGTVVYNHLSFDDVEIKGRNHEFFNNTDDLLEYGRALNLLDVQQQQQVALIGKNIESKLFLGQDPMGKVILINGRSYTIVGGLQHSVGFSADSNDDAIVIPYTNAMSLLNIGLINSVDVFLKDSKQADATTKEIENVMNTAFNYNEDGYMITNYQFILDTIKDVTQTMTLMLAGLASISLLVGGIGIMNMMLVSVTERTMEIGLRKALGAKPSIIQTQFLMEAVFLSMFGGFIGLLVGLMIAYGFSLFIGINFTIAGYSVLLAIGFSAFIGIIFGYLPAKRASELNPIDALRSVG
jgi:putative ABC transport system permease protein